MTAYNREKYIIEAIESVLASTYKNWELIVLDDCSKDNTVLIAKSYEAKDKRIKVYINEKNLGDYPNRNRAANYANGKYLKYVDSDDKLFPDGLRYCVQNMEDHNDAKWGIAYPFEIQGEYVLKPADSIRSHFFGSPFLKIGPGGTIINRDFFLQIGKFPVVYGPANDMYFNLLAALKGNVIVLKPIFLYYRIHEGQEQNNRYSYLYNNCRYLKDALDNLTLPLSKSEVNWLQQKRKRRFTVNIVKYFFRTFDIKKTRFAIKQAGFSLRDAFEGIFH